jgi:hypothetical protein
MTKPHPFFPCQKNRLLVVILSNVKPYAGIDQPLEHAAAHS